MIININQSIPKILYVNRRAHHNGIIDTAKDKHNNIENFMKIMDLVSSYTLPSFISLQVPSDWYIEKALEEIRQKYFKAYPSRLSCTFLGDRYYFDSHKHQAIVYKGSKVVKCDMAIINFLRGNPHALSAPNILMSYWEGKSLSQALMSPVDHGSLWEYLVQGEVHLQPIER